MSETTAKRDNVYHHRVAASDVEFKFGPDRQLRCMVLLCLFARGLERTEIVIDVIRSSEYTDAE